MMMILSLKSVTGHHEWRMYIELSSVPPTLSAVSVCQRTPQSVFSIHIFTRGAGNSGAARSSRVRHLQNKLGLGLCLHFTILCVCGDFC